MTTPGWRPVVLSVFLIHLLMTTSLRASPALQPADSKKPERPPSTPEQLKKVCEVASYLEANPFDPKAADMRKALLLFITEAPDVTVNLNLVVLGNLDADRTLKDNLDVAILVAQPIFSMARFSIENPGAHPDDLKVQVAGVEGMLAAYQAMKKVKPSIQFRFAEDLLKLQVRGELSSQIKKVLEAATRK